MIYRRLPTYDAVKKFYGHYYKIVYLYIPLGRAGHGILERRSRDDATVDFYLTSARGPVNRVQTS